ncbi:MAG: AMP-binding protein [Myxococcales bacterium]|nr:AMP-binding protein [Myxococcales bacterium]
MGRQPRSAIALPPSFGFGERVSSEPDIHRFSSPNEGTSDLSRSFNIASYLDMQAKIRPHQRAVIFPQDHDAQGRTAWTQLTFVQLFRLTNDYARGLRKRGVQPGDRVSLLVKPSLDFIPLVFALFKIGAIPVLIDPGMGRTQFADCIARMAPRVLIAAPIVRWLRPFFRQAFTSVKVAIYTHPRSLVQLQAPATTPEDELVHPASTKKHDVAAILFTSGSTGPAKGVVYTHGIFDAQIRFIRDMYDIRPGEIDLACFPLFGLFSIALGMTVVIPEMEPTRPAQADPARLIQAINDNGCTSSFGSPAIWKRVAYYALNHKLKLPSLRRILMAGAPVPIELHEDFTKILTKGAEVHTPFGATESLPVASIASQEVLSVTAQATRNGAGTCVGHPAPDMVIRIIRIVDAPIERWEDVQVLGPTKIGEICVRGPVVTHRYEDHELATRESKIRETDANGETHIVHRMGDVGYLDDQGRLWFCGRKKHRVETDNGPMFTVPCETIFNLHPSVARSALVGVNHLPVLVVQLEANHEPSDRLTLELLAMGAKWPHTRVIKTILYHHNFPVDVRHNAKIRRESLQTWAKTQLRSTTAGIVSP